MWLLVAATASVVVLLAGIVRGLAPAPYPIHAPWLAFAAFFLVAETFVAHVHIRRESHTLSLSAIGLVLGLFLVTPSELLAAQLIGAAAAFALIHRQRPLKLGLNLAQFGLCTSVALIAFNVAAGGAAHGPRTWAAALLAASLASLLSVTLVSAAISLAERTPMRHPRPSVSAIALLITVASVGVALAAVELLAIDAWLLLLLVVPAAACGLTFWAYMAQRCELEHMGVLYDAMRRIQQAPDVNKAVTELLAAVRPMFDAGDAELILLGDDSNGGSLHGRASGNGVTVRSVAITPEEALLVSTVAGSDTAVVLPRRHDPHALDGFLATRGLRDAIATALRGEKGVLGALVVGNSISDVTSFTPHDGKLFATFASQASVLLENDRLTQSLARLTELKEELRHQAFHDATTGLPNRTLFAEHVRTALLRASRGHSAIVLFLDLDDFKTINDSMGHAAGDELIAAAAKRLRKLVRPQDIPARLGGDEFGILLEDVDVAGAEEIAERVVHGLAAPFDLRGREICVHVSVGLAVADPGVQSADELLCNADVAMYAAKEGGKRRYAIYEPHMRSRVHARLELGAALERAVQHEEFGVHYQPIVSLRDGRIVAFEALLRWYRPGHGIVSPLDFLAIADETGLISRINRVVLRQACRQARAWQDEFPGQAPAISVNFSPSDLLNPMLDFEVASVLRETGLEPGRLIVEVTEGGAMRNPEAAIETMQKLRELGVQLALDDFGTGYSSLSHLHELPVDMLKIAKPFIDQLGERHPSTPLAETIVQLAELLGIEVVAEGIEHEYQAKQLLTLDCPLGQGFYFSEPLDPRAATIRLRKANDQRSSATEAGELVEVAPR